jgi:hypothetical protein
MTRITNIITDPTVLVLHNQPTFSSSTSAIKTLVVVGNYAPTGLDYESFTNLERLFLFNGEATMTEDIQTAIQNLAKNTNKLKYLEVKQWGATSLAASAFLNASQLQTVVGFEDVITLGSSAFQGCTALTSVASAFANITSAGGSVFQSCTELTSLSFEKLTSIGSSFLNGASKISSVYFPNMTNGAPNRAFNGCGQIKSIYMPKARTGNILDYAFNGCAQLNSLAFDTTGSHTISTGAFSGCAALPSLDLRGASDFWASALTNCGIKELTVKDALGTIQWAFSGVSLDTLNLIGVSVPNGIVATCGKLGAIQPNVTTFRFLPNASILSRADVVSYINEVLALTREDCKLLKADATITGILELGTAVQGLNGFTSVANSLINRIVINGTTYTWAQ